MTSKLPLHKQLGSPENPKKPRPKKTKAVIRGSKNSRTYVSGIVTALRSDGTVNVRIGGMRFNGVPTLETYDIRSVNDKVSIIKAGSQYIVLGKLGSDDMIPNPTVYPKSTAQWTWGAGGGASDHRMWVGDSRVGRQSERFPISDSDYYARWGICYFDGSTNTLNGPADLVKQIDVYVERDEWDDGYEGAASFAMYGFVQQTGFLPEDIRTLAYNTTIVPNSIQFTLEPGEFKVLTLPDTWRNNIGAGSVSADTIRGFVIEPGVGGDKKRIPANINLHTYGRFVGISGAVRIYDTSA